MRRFWSVRLAWLLLLAIIGSAVAPLSHDHDARPASRFGVFVYQAPVEQVVSSGADNALADPSEQDADGCLLCAHLAAQNAVLQSADPLLAIQASPQHHFKADYLSFLARVPAWLRPALRAPPTPSVLIV